MKTILIYALVLLFLWVACSNQSGTAAWPFPANPEFGYVQIHPEDTTRHSTYRLVRFTPSSWLRDFDVLSEVEALKPPQLCSPTSASVLAPHSPDSSMLVIITLNPSIKQDTVLVYAEERGQRSSYTIPDGRVYNLDDYAFSGADSLLFWMRSSGHRRSILEIGRIGPDNQYRYLEKVVESEPPRMTNDFSQVLVSYIWPMRQPAEYANARLIRIYDLAIGDWVTPMRITGNCYMTKRRTREGVLYCVRDDVGDSAYTGPALCAVRDSIPQPLLELESSVYISEYHLYPDSIVVEARARRGHRDHGVQTYVVHEPE